MEFFEPLYISYRNTSMPVQHTEIVSKLQKNVDEYIHLSRRKQVLLIYIDK